MSSDPSQVVIIDLLRHGEPVGGKTFRGSTDDPLSEKGWQQLHCITEGHKPWQQVITSPLIRCYNFAHDFSCKYQLPLITVPELKEMHFGLWEGRLPKDVWDQSPDLLSNFWENPRKNAPPCGENYSDFQNRVLLAAKHHLYEFTQESKLVITHAGVVKALLQPILKVSDQDVLSIDIPLATLTRIKFERRTDGKENFKVEFMAEPINKIQCEGLI